MGNETTYQGVMSGLIRLISALNANAADLAHWMGRASAWRRSRRTLRGRLSADGIHGRARQQPSASEAPDPEDLRAHRSGSDPAPPAAQ